VSSPHTPLMNCEQLAEHLGVTVRFVRRLVDERRVPFMKIGRFVRFDPNEIDAWIAECRRGPVRSNAPGDRPSQRRHPASAVPSSRRAEEAM